MMPQTAPAFTNHVCGALRRYFVLVFGVWKAIRSATFAPPCMKFVELRRFNNSNGCWRDPREAVIVFRETRDNVPMYKCIQKRSYGTE